jgi:hypothetical protein
MNDRLPSPLVPAPRAYSAFAGADSATCVAPSLGVTGSEVKDMGVSVSRTHAVLVTLVRSYIQLVRSEWPDICRRDPDFSVETAHNYGLGLIRMLAEYQIANGLKDELSVRLAIELSEAKRLAQRKIREPSAAVVEPKPGGSRWRRGYRKNGSATRPSSK